MIDSQSLWTTESGWKQVRLNNVGRICRAPRVLDRHVRISGRPGDIRQFAVRGLYRLLAVRVGNGKRNATSRTLFRNFVKALADITIGKDGTDVRIGRRANNPFLLNASCDDTDFAVPRLFLARARASGHGDAT